jgi:hypothetical protein
MRRATCPSARWGIASRDREKTPIVIKLRPISCCVLTLFSCFHISCLSRSLDGGSGRGACSATEPTVRSPLGSSPRRRRPSRCLQSAPARTSHWPPTRTTTLHVTAAVTARSAARLDGGVARVTRQVHRAPTRPGRQQTHGCSMTSLRPTRRACGRAALDVRHRRLTLDEM